MLNNRILSLFLSCLLASSTLAQEILYTMPSEEHAHEGTWIQWPHNHTYSWGASDFVPAFREMVSALIESENVHIVAYNNQHVNQITNQLTNNGISMANVSIHVYQNDDFWVRDNGPIFVYSDQGDLTILDWGFNGWGDDAPYELCDQVPSLIGDDIGYPVVDLNHVVLEGGAVEINGEGSLMATWSSILGDHRNPGMSESEMEEYLTTYLGITNFIWLEGVYGGNADITDQHIDAVARFHGANTIVTMSEEDLVEWELLPTDIEILYSATNVQGQPFNIVTLPITDNDVVTEWGEDMQFKGSYVNYYVANSVVLVPQYDDPRDAEALEIVSELYPSKQAVGIDCRNLFGVGGMVHCVTQQQPLELISSINTIDNSQEMRRLLKVCDAMGREVIASEAGSILFYIYDNGDVEKLINLIN